MHHPARAPAAAASIRPATLRPFPAKIGVAGRAFSSPWDDGPWPGRGTTDTPRASAGTRLERGTRGGAGLRMGAGAASGDGPPGSAGARLECPRAVLVTGANRGQGFALCRRVLAEHDDTKVTRLECLL